MTQFDQEILLLEQYGAEHISDKLLGWFKYLFEPARVYNPRFLF